MNSVSQPRVLSWLLLLLGTSLAGCGDDGGQKSILDNDADPATAPVVTSVAPSNNATGVPVNDTVISAEFSESVMALSSDNFTVTCETPCTSPTGMIKVDSTSHIATYVASADLEPQTRYTATVTAAESIDSGLSLEKPYVWRFTTGSAVPATTDPAPAAEEEPPTTDEPSNTAITTAFTEEMDLHPSGTLLEAGVAYTAIRDMNGDDNGR